MPRIDTIEELMQVLDEHPQWLEALRTRLLTRELIELPRRFAEFSAAVDQNFARAERRMDSLATKEQMQKVVNDQQKIVDDVGRLKGFMTENVVRRDASGIAMDMGFANPRLLTREEAAYIAYSPALADLPRNERISFRKADAIIEASDEAGETCYVALEVSYTADERDTARALRNADLLRRATGVPAVAAVAYVHADDRIRTALESGGVRLHELHEFQDSADYD